MFPRRAFPSYGNADWQVFTARKVETGGGFTAWQTWQKPPGCQWVYFYIQGSGAGGGKSANGAVTTAAGGGGSGGVSRIFIPALFLPDLVYLHVGRGGNGSTTAGTNGEDGRLTLISSGPPATPFGAATGARIATQFGGSGGVSTGAGGAGGASVGAAGFAFAAPGIYMFTAGEAGTAGAAAANGAGTARAPYTSGILTTGGAGGGNGTGAGGAISAGGWNIQAIAGGVGTTGGAGRDGKKANIALTPATVFSGSEPALLFTGGSGGGGHTTGAGGRGGDAGYGGGGGGGGSASGAGTSGDGGNGGDGFVLIGAF